LSVQQVAERLGVCDETVRRRIRSGALPAYRLTDGRTAPLRIDPVEFERWLRS
jgi:excisionase family DNA binding protein